MSDSPYPSETPTSRDPAAWSACPSGELGAIGAKRRAALLRDRRARGLGVALAAAVVVLAAVFWPQPDRGPVYGGITCGQCVQMMPEYNDHLTDGAKFPPDDAVAMAEHLRMCPLCRNRFETQYPGVLAAAATATGTLLLALSRTGPPRG